MNYLLTFFKGMAMGAADVVPGVSGGTIAFITGVYDKLLESIRRINPRLIPFIRKQGLKATLNHINAPFLLSLFSGIFISIITLAKLVSWLLITYPIPLWSFFFGLILVSVLHILKQIQHRKLTQLAGFIIGAFAAYAITIIQPLHLEPTSMNILIAGGIAICAMILPGISGSFILLLIGMYTPILSAVKNLQITPLLIFLSGCVLGLLCFSHILSWLLKHHRDITLTTLTGLMVGTLPKIWPWKETLTWRTNSHGEQVPLLQQNLLPSEYEHLTKHPSQLLLAIIMMLVAISLVLILEKIARKIR